MTKYLHIICVLLLLDAHTTFAQKANDYQSHQSGDWNSASTWERFDGTTWVTPAPSVPTNAVNVITIQSEHTVTVTTSVTIDQTTISAGAGLIINPGVVLSFNNGTGNDLTVSGGTLQVDGTLNTLGTTGHALVFNGATSIINNGTIDLTTVGASTATFSTSGSNITISSTSTPTATKFSSLSVTTSATVTSSIPITTSGTLTANAAILNINAGFNAMGAIAVTGTGSSITVNNLSGTFSGSASNLSVSTGIFTANVPITFAGSTLVSGTGTKSFQDVTVSGAVSCTSASSLTVNGNLTNNGTINFANGTWVLAGANKVLQSSGSLSTTFYNLTVPASAIIALNTPFTAGGTITASGGGILAVNTSFNAGALTATGAGSSITASNPFTLTGTLTSSTGGVITANGGFNTGAVNVTGAGSSITVNNSPYSVTGTLTVGTGAAFTANTNAAGNLSGNLAASGAFTANELTTFAGSTLVSGAGTKSFQDVTVSGTVSCTSASSLTVNGNLTNNGTISSTNGTWILAGTSKSLSGTPSATTFYNLTVPASASIDAQVPFTSGGTISVSGTLTTEQTVTANIVTVTGTGSSITANSLFTPSGLLTVSNGGTFTNNASGFTTGGNMTITGTGSSFVATNPFTVTGTLTVSAGAAFIPTVDFTVGGITVTGANSSISMAGNTVNVGTLNVAASSTFTADASSNIYISGNMSTTSTFTSSGAVYFNGATVMSGGTAKTFNDIHVLSGATVISSGNIVLTMNGNIINDGTFNLSAGTTTFTNTGNKTISGSNPVGLFTTVINAIGVTVSTPITFAGTLTVNGTLTSNANLSAVGNVTIANGGTLTTNSSDSIGGTLTVSGTFAANSDLTLTSTLGNNFNVAASGNFTSVGTVYFNGVTTMVTSGTRIFKDIVVNNGMSLKGNVNFTVNSSITNNGGTIALTGGTVTIAQNATLSASGIPTTTFYAVTVSSGETFTISNFDASAPITLAALTLNGDLNHTSTNTITLTGTGNQLSGGGNLSSLGTIQFTGARVTVPAGGIINFTNVTVGGTATALTTSAATYTIDGALVVNIGCTINGGNVTFGNSLSGTTPSIESLGTINFGNFTVSSGHTLTSASGTINLTGNFTNNGSFTQNAGTVQFSTAGTKTISGNSTTFYNINIGNGTGSTTVTNSLAPLNLAGRLTLNTAVVNTFNTNDNLVLLSTADSPTADGSIGPLRGTAVSKLNGTYTAQRYMSNEGSIWRYVAAPVVGATVAQLKSTFPVSGVFSDPSDCPTCTGTPAYKKTSPSLYYYDETTAQYVDYPAAGQLSTASPLTNARGYSVYVRQNALTGPATINFVGTHPVTPIGGLPLPVSPVKDGYSLVGNPYPSPIIWDPTNSTLYPSATNVYTTAQITNNGTGGPGYIILNPGDVIAPGQAFWVASSDVNATLTISESAKTVATNSTQFYRKTANDGQDKMVITMTKLTTGMVDVATLKIQDGSLRIRDIYDANKWKGFMPQDISTFDVSTLSDDFYSLSQNSVPSLNYSQKILLKVNNLLEQPTDGSQTAEMKADFTISFAQRGILNDLPWVLHDNALGTDTDVSQGQSYSFSVNSAIASTIAPDRFYLKISSLTDMENSKQLDENCAVYPNPASDRLHISFKNDTPIEPQLFDINGQLIKSIMVTPQGDQWIAEEDVRSYSRGIYFVKIKTDKSVLVKKIILK